MDFLRNFFQKEFIIGVKLVFPRLSDKNIKLRNTSFHPIHQSHHLSLFGESNFLDGGEKKNHKNNKNQFF